MKKYIPIAPSIDPKQVADDTLSRARRALGEWTPAGRVVPKTTRAIVVRRSSAIESRSRRAIDAYQGYRRTYPDAPMGLYISTLV